MYVTKHALVGKWLMTVVTHILEQMPGINKPQRKFLLALFATMLAVRGRVNFRNLARYSTYSERTHHRQFQQPFDFPSFNQPRDRTSHLRGDHFALSAGRHLHPQKRQAHLRARQVLERLRASH